MGRYKLRGLLARKSGKGYITMIDRHKVGYYKQWKHYKKEQIKRGYPTKLVSGTKRWEVYKALLDKAGEVIYINTINPNDKHYLQQCLSDLKQLYGCDI